MAGAVEIPATVEAIKFISMTPQMAASLVGIGFVGGMLSGFLGSGGAFIMTPAMMSLGIPGIMAVAANITHKFGKAIMGSKKHGEYGNVDKRMGLVMFIALFIGVQLAVSVSKNVLAKAGTAGSNLYISVMFVVILTWVSWFMYRDVKRTAAGGVPSRGGLAEKIGSLNIPPMIHFKVANVRCSLWLALLVGLATGFLAGTIGVGGFIGVPAMIYLLGVPTYVAAGTELFLAIFSGMQGAYLYAINGLVDLRITLLLYVGSLLGLTIGAVGTRVVRGMQIKQVMTAIIAMVAVSRAVVIPKYLVDMKVIKMSQQSVSLFKYASDAFLYGSGLVGCSMILYWMYRAWQRASKMEKERAALGSEASVR
ncbi:MAG: sulfite exporter TauE/SafE family protein [Bacillota bacterium]|uniref:sulfite exporter TauE/SafE family protein n=1 Tax=Desulfurispora thermophila TaxID=265470 RepID=UPI00037EDED4|nr:sulfite exporter TauE/SafE family protein [Desulfurispora thermophila]